MLVEYFLIIKIARFSFQSCPSDYISICVKPCPMAIVKHITSIIVSEYIEYYAD